MLIDNRSGAGGTIGSEVVAKAAPDGYTLLAVPISHAAIGSLYNRLGYDPQKDFAAVIQLASAPNVTVVHPSVLKSEMVKWAKVAAHAGIRPE